MKCIEQIDKKLLDIAIKNKLDMYISKEEINDMLESDEILVIDRFKLTARVVEEYKLQLSDKGFFQGVPIYTWLQQALSRARKEFL